jgi:hypothetical protein
MVLSHSGVIRPLPLHQFLSGLYGFGIKASLFAARDCLKVIEHTLPQGFSFTEIIFFVNAASFLRCSFPLIALIDSTIKFSPFPVLFSKLIDSHDDNCRDNY